MISAAAAWVSQGLMAFTHAGGHRIAMLPMSARPLVLAVCAAAAVALLVRARASVAPLLLLGFVFLPWIPGRLPAAFLLWLGPLTLLVWAAVLVTMVATVIVRHDTPLRVRAPGFVAAGVMALALYAAAAWQVSPSRPGGDEPHYLVITQSLLNDGDLRIENNHRNGDYQSYYRAPLQPDFRRRGRNGEIYSIHAPGVSALVAPAFAIGGYRGVVIFLLLLSAVGSALAWHIARLATREPAAAWFAWGAVTFAATSVFHSFAVYPDGPGAVIVLSGVWALLRAHHEREHGSTSVRPWLLHGAALAMLPWLHTRFAVLAGTLGAVILLRLAKTRNAGSKATAFLVIPAISAVAWIAHFIAIYGTPDPSAPYAGEAGSFAFVPGGVTGLFFDSRFGLLAYAPVLVAGFVGLALMLVRGVQPRLAVESLFVLVPYVLTVTHFAMWWGGRSAPARFAVPVLPMLVVPAAVCWASLKTVVSRASAMAALGFTLFATSVLVAAEGGRLAYNSIRGPSALWLTYINPVVNVSGGLPLWSRTADAPLFRDTAVWLAALLFAWTIARYLARKIPAVMDIGRASAMTLAIYGVAAMVALSVVWRFRGSEPIAVASAQMSMLRHIANAPRVLAMDVDAMRPVSRDNIPGRLHVELKRDPSPPAPRNDTPLFAIASVPAGEYRITSLVNGSHGWLMLGVGRDQFALTTEPVSTFSAGIELRFAANVRELVVRGDEDAQRSVRGLRLEPLSLLRQRMRPTGLFALRAVRYDGTTVYFMDDGSFAEPEAFWVGGSTTSTVVLQPEAYGSVVELQLRNAPVQNVLRLETRTWRNELRLAPGEERAVRVPLDVSHEGTLLRLSPSEGFRPSAVDASSRDHRFLGVWVKPK